MIKVAHMTSVDLSLRYLLSNQIRALQTEGYTIVGISTPGPDVPYLEETLGIRHIPVRIERAMAPMQDLITLWQLVGVLRREKFTIVHTHNPKPGLLGQIAARLAGVPIVVNTIHGFYFHEHMTARKRRFFITLEQIAARCSTHILSQSREDVETAIAEGIAGPDKITHLGNGIDLTQFDPDKIDPADSADKKRELGLPDDMRVIGFVGRLAARRKGFLDLLRAARILKDQGANVRFLIIGTADTGKPDAVEPETAHEYGVMDQFIFLGHQDNDKLPLLYSLMDVVTLPSLFEGVPRALMEAAAMGRPLVATDVRGNREVVFPDQNGHLVPLGDPQALADALQHILADDDQLQAMGAASRQIAQEHFDERRVFERVKALYRELLAQKGVQMEQATS